MVMNLKIGDTFKNCTLLEVLGKGGFGTVYLADCQSEEIPDKVALKILHPEHAGVDLNIQRFHREAKLARKLIHPHVVRIWEDGVEQGLHYIIMDWAPGKTFLDYMRDGHWQTRPSVNTAPPEDKTVTLKNASLDVTQPAAVSKGKEGLLPPLEEILCLMKQAAAVLQAAHEVGLIHRDLKLENLLVHRDSRGMLQLKILDFGLAKNLVDPTVQLTAKDQAVGTPAYMSPEQYQGRNLDIRSDLFSLGVTFYLFATGEKPFSGPEVQDFMSQILTVNPTPPHKIRPILKKNFSKVILRLLEKDYNDRYPQPNDLVEDLNRLERGQAPLSYQKARRPKKPYRKTLLSVLLLLLLGGGGYYFTLESPPVPDSPDIFEEEETDPFFSPEDTLIPEASPSLDSKSSLPPQGEESLEPVLESQPSPEPPLPEPQGESLEPVLESQPSPEPPIPAPQGGKSLEEPPPVKKEPDRVVGFDQAFEGQKIETTAKDRFQRLSLRKTKESPPES